MRCRTCVLLCAFLLSPFLASLAESVHQESQSRAVLANLASLPLGFEQNSGQADRNIRFISYAEGYSISISNEEIVIDFGPDSASPKNEIVHLRMIRSNQNSRPEGLDPLPGVVHYYISNDPAKWKTDIRQFSRVSYRNIYPDIDLVLYGNRRQLEFDFDVAPRANASSITFKIEGALVRSNHGNLELITPSGKVAVLRKPELYQDSGGVRRKVSGRYRMHQTNEISFVIGRYDRNRPLIIDPALSYSTFVTDLLQLTVFKGQFPANSPEHDAAFGMAVDSTGAAYVTGSAVIASGTKDSQGRSLFFERAFVIKLDATGSNLVYSTYLGGAPGLDPLPFKSDSLDGTSAGQAIALDANRNAYIVGQTNQPDFPVTGGAFSTTPACPNGGSNVVCTEPFAAKFDANGKLVYSTFLVNRPPLDKEGPVPTAVAVDSSGALYVTGAASPTFGSVAVAGLTTTANAFQKTPNNNSSAFVLKLHPDGSSLDYSTFLGGSKGETAGGIAVDANGIAYVDGGTSSSDFPTTTGAFQTSNSGTSAFFTKLKADGSGLVYSTFLGASGIQSQALAIALDGNKSAYVAGTSTGNGFPTTAGAFETSTSSTAPNFVSKFDVTGNLVYSTYLGDSANVLIQLEGQPIIPDAGIFGIEVDSAGNAYVGINGGSTLPALNSIQPFPTCSRCTPVTISELNPTGTTVVFTTFFGTSVLASGMALDPNGNVYIAGNDFPNCDLFPCANPQLPTTIGAFQVVPGNTDPDVLYSGPIFVSKITPSLGAPVPAVTPRQPQNFPVVLRKGQTSSPIQVQLGNYGDADLSITSISFGGANQGDFAQTNNCGATVHAGQNCTVSTTFSPTVDSGVRTANLTFNFGGGLASQTIAVQGTAGFPVSQIIPTSIDFGGALVIGFQGCGPGTPPIAQQRVQITNTGTADLHISSVGILGSSDFQFFNCGKPVFFPTLLIPGADGTITIALIPTSAGMRTGTLVIQDDAAGSPHQVTLTGVGIGSGDFGIGADTSASATVTAGQTATYLLRFVAGSGFASTVSVTCNGLPMGAACSDGPVALSGPGGVETTLSVTTTGHSASNVNHAPLHASPAWWCFAAVLGLTFARFGNRRRLLVLLSSLLLGAMISCGGGSGGGGGHGPTPSGTFSFTVTATSGSTSRSTTLTLIVQ